jgi:hypothetical protein
MPTTAPTAMTTAMTSRTNLIAGIYCLTETSLYLDLSHFCLAVR